MPTPQSASAAATPSALERVAVSAPITRLGVSLRTAAASSRSPGRRCEPTGVVTPDWSSRRAPGIEASAER
jgi:hypothetical protein